MLKIVLIGVWMAIVTAGSTYFSANMLSSYSGGKKAEAVNLGVEPIVTDMTSVPMIRGGEIIGYVIIQLTFETDKSMLKTLNLEPKPYLVDAAFRVVYSNTQVDFTRLRASDIDDLTAKIAAEANKRMGGELVKQVLIQQMNYVRKDEIRTDWIKKK